MIEEAQEHQVNSSEVAKAAFPEMLSYNVLLSEQTMAWIAVLLEGQALILAKLNGTEPEEEKKNLLARLPGKQEAVKRLRAIEENPGEVVSLSAA